MCVWKYDDDDHIYGFILFLSSLREIGSVVFLEAEIKARGVESGVEGLHT